MNAIAALLLARLLTAAAGEPVCVPTNDARVTECGVKTSRGVQFMQCIDTGKGQQTCFAK